MSGNQGPLHSFREVADALGVSRARVAQVFKARGGARLVAEWNNMHPEHAIKEQKGPKPTLIPEVLLKEIFTELKLRNLSTRSTEISHVIGTFSRKLPENVSAVLGGRVASGEGFRELLDIVIARSKTLKIQSVSGSVFNQTDSATKTFKAFETRAERVRKDQAEPPEMLFLHPLSRAARLRSNAEEGPRKPPFEIESSDVRDSSKFLQTTRMGTHFVQTWNWIHRNHARLALDLERIHWSRVPPSIFLIWSEDVAIVEPYGFGRLAAVDHDETICIGGRAPLLIVRPGGSDDYHERLKNGFDWIHEPSKQTGGVVRYRVMDIQKELKGIVSKDISLGWYPTRALL